MPGGRFFGYGQREHGGYENKSVMVAPLRLRGEKNHTNHDHQRHQRSDFEPQASMVFWLREQGGKENNE